MPIEMAKLQNLLQLEMAAKTWWDAMSPKWQQGYIKSHPRSRYSKMAKRAAPDKRSAPTTRAVAPSTNSLPGELKRRGFKQRDAKGPWEHKNGAKVHIKKPDTHEHHIEIHHADNDSVSTHKSNSFKHIVRHITNAAKEKFSHVKHAIKGGTDRVRKLLKRPKHVEDFHAPLKRKGTDDKTDLMHPDHPRHKVPLDKALKPERNPVKKSGGSGKVLNKGKGSLHEHFGIERGQPIPVGKLKKLARSDHPLASRATMVLKLKGHKTGKENRAVAPDKPARKPIPVTKKTAPPAKKMNRVADSFEDTDAAPTKSKTSKAEQIVRKLPAKSKTKLNGIMKRASDAPVKSKPPEKNPSKMNRISADPFD